MIDLLHKRKLRTAAGFTIIELMIATAVLATMLLIATTIITSIGNLYYKGVNESKIQDDSRSIISQVTQDLELNDGFKSSNVNLTTYGQKEAYCVGSVRYTFVVGMQLGTQSGQSHHVLWRDSNPSQSSCAAVAGFPDPTDTGTELIAPNSRLVKFTITGSSPYAVSVGVAYGDSDLLCSPSVSGSCTSGGTMSNPGFIKQDLLCKGNAGSSFCATAGLSTTVVQRLTKD